MVKSPRGRLAAFPPGRGTGGAMIGPLPTTLALAGRATGLDCAWAAPGLSAWAKAPTQLPTNSATASLGRIVFFIVDLAIYGLSTMKKTILPKLAVALL